MSDEAVETILIVDDEEPVRRTFADWLAEAKLDCTILTAADAEAALRIANQQPIDLAILDWALGAGEDGLQLLQDLYTFHPDVVAIMVTGFANQATPLDAMRMGVRDYLDKNHDLSRDTFLAAVRKQLEQIRPAKSARRLHRGLAAFREAVEKILPLVQSTAALNDPAPVPESVGSLVRFLAQITLARDGVLLVRCYDADHQPPETCRVYDAQGKLLDGRLAPFARSLAGTAVSRQDACVLNDLSQVSGVELQPFEEGRRNLLAAAIAVAPGIHAVIELFDKTAGSFTPADQRLVQAAADLGAEMLRQALGQRQQQRMLFDAVAAALKASDQIAAALPGGPQPAVSAPPPAPVMEQLRHSLSAAGHDAAGAEQSLALAEAIRVLGAKHGALALAHCLQLVDNLTRLLDKMTS